MKLQDKQYKEIIYNFCIQHIYRKHHFHHEVIITTENAHAAISEYNNLMFHLFANKEHTHMSHSKTSTTTNILSNTLLNTNHSKHHQIQLQVLSTIMLLLILSSNKHIYKF